MWNRLRGGTNANGHDIRITTTADVPVDFWIEQLDPINKHALIWVEVPSIAANGSVTLKLAYGDLLLNTAGNIATTMIFGDDFRTATALDTRWQAGNGGVASTATAFALDTTNHYLKATSSGTTTTGRLMSATAFSDTVPLIAQAKAQAVTGSNGIMVIGLNTPTVATTTGGVGVLSANVGQDHVRYGATWDTFSYQQLNQPARFTVANNGGSTHYNTFTRDNLVNGSWVNAWQRPAAGNYAFTITSLRVVLGNRYDGGGALYNDEPVDVRWDWVLVRKYHAAPPTAVVSNVEQMQ
jgi:hypothetical protein